METIKPINILNKKPFGYLLPQGINVARLSDGSPHPVNSTTLKFQEIDQIEFLRELDPRSHKIFDSNWYQNDKKQDPDTGRWYWYPVERCALPFQYIIKTKQLTHLCGNNIQFTDSNQNPSDTDRDLLINFKQAWKNKNMEVAWYDSANSVKCTGDVAFCGYLADNVFGYRIFSFFEGDILYPHYNYVTGKMDVFGREYSRYNLNGKEVEKILEVWDNKKMYRFKRDTKPGIKKAIKYILELFGLNDGWSLEYEEFHGFPFMPISYHRNKYGACWTFIQPQIEQYEKDFSRYLEVNKSNVRPIIVITGDDVEIKGDADKPITSIVTGAGGDAKRIPAGEVSQSYENQLRIQRENIFMGAFVVLPPEARSGDESGISIKIKYSPAIEQAMADANEYNPFVDDMVKIFKYGYSVEVGKIAEYQTMNITGEIIPFIHQNEAEIMQSLMTGVSAGYLSKESAAQECPYSANDEMRRLKEQMKSELAVNSITDVMYSSNKDKEGETEVIEKTEAA